MNKYELIRVIGDGTYGIVYEGKNKETKEKVAIKKLKQKYRTLEECKNKIEITILEKVYHDNIIHLKDVIRDFNGEISYIFEYCDCNLLEFIDTHKEKNKKIPEQIIREIILQITKGLKYLHSKNYFHRDLKPENILLILNKYDLNNLSNNINESGIKVKIADFGTAKKIPNKDALTITEYVCTRWYRSPECVLRTDYYDETSDIWALGCIMAELYKLGPIFPGENEFDQINQIFKILGTPTKCKWPWGYNQAENLGIKFPVYYKKDLKGILGYIGQDGINLLNEIFQFDSTKRPSCNKILNHPYFRLIPKPSKNIIPYGVRNSFPLNIKTEIYDSYYINFIKHKNQRKAKNEINAKNNYITYSFYIDKTNSNHKKISDNMIFNQNLGHKNSDIKVNYYNNSSSTDIRKNKRKNIISNCNKILYNSNTKSEFNNNIKYITIDESKKNMTAKRLFKSIKNNEESKVNENNDYKKESSRIILPNQRKNNSIYFSINFLTKRSSLNKNFIVEKKNLDNKSIIKLNQSNNTTIDQKNKSKKFNKAMIKKIKDFNIINNIHSSTINKYQIYNTNINNTTSRIINTENNSFAKINVEYQNTANFKRRNNIINVSNKRNKQRKNYKFSEINGNIETKYHNNNINKSIKNIILDKNAKRCICSLGKNSIDNQSVLMKNVGYNSKINTTKNINNHNQQNLSYNKYVNHIDNNQISLSPLKNKKNNTCFTRLVTLSKKGNGKEINSNELINKTSNRKRFNKIVMREEESKLNSNINNEKRK